MDERRRELSADPRCIYTTRRQLFAVLARMRAWADEGLSDREITEAIQQVQRQRGAR